MDVETVVPGHGPITDKRGVAVDARVSGLHHRRGAQARYDAGMDAFEAARDIALDDYETLDRFAERIVVNVATLYREFSGDDSETPIAELFGRMAQVVKDRRS